MTGIPHFSQDFEEIIMELATLAQLCGIRLRDPGMADAVLRGDELIRSENPLAFDKMRGLLGLAYTMVEQSVAAEGAQSTGEFVARAMAEVAERREQFG